MKKYLGLIVLGVALVLSVLIATRVIFFRLDLTDDKRFSISKQSREQLEQMSRPLEVTIYLGGEVDANVARLKRAIDDLLDEFNAYSAQKIVYRYVAPYSGNDDKARYRAYDELESRGIRGMTMSQRDSKGNLVQGIVFPWAEVVAGEDTIPVCLMQPAQVAPEENINSAIDGLEYGFSDAIRILQRTKVDKVAFIEGHGELTEVDLYDATSAIARYFQVDFGELRNNPNELDDYKAIIIAKPQAPFSEKDKFIIDQYLMKGGRVFWLLDAVKLSTEALAKSGLSPVIPLELNLTDMLFRYGVRLEPSVVQDMQCVSMPINVARQGEQPQFEAVPWTYAPLLLPSPIHPATKKLMQVKSEFPSFVSQTSEENGIAMDLMLITSNASRVDRAPTEINLQNMMHDEPDTYFRHQYIPVAVSMEGQFPSVYAHRMAPQGIEMPSGSKIIEQSAPTRMVVVADGDVIRNDVERRKDGQLGIIELGLDRMTGQTYGNRDFVVNALLYLTDANDWMALRNRTLKIHQLNKASLASDRGMWMWLNVVLPPLVLLLLGGVYLLVRRTFFRTHSKRG